MHDHEGGARGGDGGDHRRIGEAAADVVDEDGARRERALGHGGPHGVHGDRDALGGEAADNRYDAFQLLRLVDAGGAGAGGLAPHVDQVRTLRDQVEAVLDGGGRVEEPAAVREGIGGHVHDAHDRTAVPRREP